MHVLGTPPAFILSQDQTLHRNRRSLCLRKGQRTSSMLEKVLPLSSPLFDCQRAPRPPPDPGPKTRPERRRDSLGYPDGPRSVKGDVACRATRARGRRPRHRPIVPGGCPPSIVGAGAFHDRVRDGNGWVRPARATEAIVRGSRPPGPRCSGCGRDPILSARCRARGEELSPRPLVPLRCTPRGASTRGLSTRWSTWGLT